MWEAERYYRSHQPQGWGPEALCLRALDQGRPIGLGQADEGQSASRKCVLNPEVGSSLGLDWKRGQQGPVWDFKCAKRLLGLFSIYWEIYQRRIWGRLPSTCKHVL